MALLCAVAASPWFAAELPQPAVTAYEEGAKGYVLTALKGRTIERIPLHYIGTYNDFFGPGYDLHLVQLEGPVAEHVGIAAGMSGSPVYLGDRLIGALSYRMGALPKDAEDVVAKPLIQHGIVANRTVLETAAQYSFEQGLTPRLMKLEEVFAKATLEQ